MWCQYWNRTQNVTAADQLYSWPLFLQNIHRFGEHNSTPKAVTVPLQYKCMGCILVSNKTHWKRKYSNIQSVVIIYVVHKIKNMELEQHIWHYKQITNILYNMYKLNYICQLHKQHSLSWPPSSSTSICMDEILLLLFDRCFKTSGTLNGILLGKSCMIKDWVILYMTN